MTREEFEYLLTTKAKGLIDQNIDEDPKRVALKISDRLVSQQVQNLQLAKKKLPTYYNNRCVILSESRQQATAEKVALERDFLKTLKEPLESESEVSTNGTLAVDLTCGLGVDSWVLSKYFDRVISVEIDELRSMIARENFSRLNLQNITVINDSAENFCANALEYHSNKIDLIFLDPARREAPTTQGESQKRIYSIEDSSPNVMELMPQLTKIAKMIVVKLSPMFDVKEVFRVFENYNISLEVSSLDNECKEVLAVIDTAKSGSSKNNQITLIQADTNRKISFKKNDIGNKYTNASISDILFNTTDGYIMVPDVVFYKSRLVESYMAQHFAHIEAFVGNDYIFARNLSPEMISGFMGKVFRVLEIHPYHPRTLKKHFKDVGIKSATIHYRQFPYERTHVLSTLNLKEGKQTQIFLTTLLNEQKVIVATQVDS